MINPKRPNTDEKISMTRILTNLRFHQRSKSKFLIPDMAVTLTTSDLPHPRGQHYFH